MNTKKVAIEETTIRDSTERTLVMEERMKKVRREEAAEAATEVEVATEAEETAVASAKEMTMTTMVSRRFLRNQTNPRGEEVDPIEVAVVEAGEAEVTQATIDLTTTICLAEAEARSVQTKRAQLR